MNDQKEQFIKPENVEDLVKELTSPNTYELESFSEAFPEQILEFSENFSTAYKKAYEFDQAVTRLPNYTGGISQENCVLFFILQFVQNVFTSTKLLFFGYQLASGNILRQVIEGMAVAILCSLNHPIKRKVNRKKYKAFSFFHAFKEDKDFARSHKAVHLLILNKEFSGLTKYGAEMLKLLKNHGNDFSHPNFRNTLLMIPKKSFGKKLYFSSSFDRERIEDYNNELTVRIELCKKIPDLIDKLMINVKML